MTATLLDAVRDVPKALMIGGEQRAASDGATFDVLDPATGQVLATVASGTVDDAVSCVDAAAAAAAGWAATAPRQRSDILRRAYELMVERADILARLIVAENGKALPDARGEVLYSAEFFRWYAEEAVRIKGEIQTAPGGANKIIVVHQPVGIAVLVTPWNFPAAMASRKIGPALAAGCTVILKPASETPLTALALAAILAEAGVPRGVVNVVAFQTIGPGRGRHAGRSSGPETVLHRIHRSRPDAAAPRQRADHQLLHGARWQRTVHRVRGCGSRCRHRGRVDRQDAERRRGLHRRQPLLCRRVHC